MNQKQLSEIIQKRLNTDLEKVPNRDTPFLFHLLGPPAIGKTFLQEHLFRHWNHLDPVYLQISGFIKNRASRLTDLLSECWDDAYDVVRLKDAYKKLLSGSSVVVHDYDHLTGERFGEDRILKHSSFIYIEGPMWLRCYDFRIPNFILFLFPKSLASWKAAYLNRNIRFRNYSYMDAEKAFELATIGWQQSITKYSFHENMAVSVNFEQPSYLPEYEIVNINKESA